MSEDAALLFARQFNQAEAVLWWGIALVMAWRLRGQAGWQRWGVPLAFAAFGVSDWIEAQTGAWWRPWWLLLLKAVCVGTFIYALWQHWRQRRQ